MSPAMASMSAEATGSMDREFATTRKPRSRNPRTSPAPIPCDAPVMTATLCVELMMNLLPLRTNPGAAVAAHTDSRTASRKPRQVPLTEHDGRYTTSLKDPVRQAAGDRTDGRCGWRRTLRRSGRTSLSARRAALRYGNACRYSQIHKCLEHSPSDTRLPPGFGNQESRGNSVPARGGSDCPLCSCLREDHRPREFPTMSRPMRRPSRNRVRLRPIYDTLEGRLSAGSLLGWSAGELDALPSRPGCCARRRAVNHEPVPGCRPGSGRARAAHGPPPAMRTRSRVRPTRPRSIPRRRRPRAQFTRAGDPEHRRSRTRDVTARAAPPQ